VHYDVFISYSRRDTKIADAICDALKEAGISFFIDKEGISAGANFPEVLASTIDSATVFLLLAGENAYKSKFTKAEILYAFNHKRSGCIVPYLIDDTPMPSDLEFLLGNVNWLYSSKCPVSSLPAEIRKALDNPDSGTIAGRKVRKKWYLWLILPVVLAAAAGVAYMMHNEAIAEAKKDKALLDRQHYEQYFHEADSLIKAADAMSREANTLETTGLQIEALHAAEAALDHADSLRAIHSGGEHLVYFNMDRSATQKQIDVRLDSMMTVWKEYAMDSWNLYRITLSKSDAQSTLDCIEYALAIKPDAELEAIKSKLTK